MIGVKAGIGPDEFHETAGQQAADDHQSDSYGNLTDDQYGAQTIAGCAHGSTRSGFPKRESGIAAGRTESGREAEYQGVDGRDSQCKREHGPIRAGSGESWNAHGRHEGKNFPSQHGEGVAGDSASKTEHE